MLAETACECRCKSRNNASAVKKRYSLDKKRCFLSTSEKQKNVYMPLLIMPDTKMLNPPKSIPKKNLRLWWRMFKLNKCFCGTSPGHQYCLMPQLAQLVSGVWSQSPRNSFLRLWGVSCLSGVSYLFKSCRPYVVVQQHRRCQLVSKTGQWAAKDKFEDHFFCPP